MEKKKLVLVCNAHIDPVWLWEWEEGLAETLATFRTAARFCEEFQEFVFCHNESILYQWVESHEPALFRTIQNLVKEGRWNIMGGWVVQPDCNMPSGESLVRQILRGKRYFIEKFGVEPRTAVNFDPFGHSRGLVQILKKSGYTSYLFCRPDALFLDLPDDDFIWVGYDGSKIVAHRSAMHYNSEKGRARAKAEQWIDANTDRKCGLVLWGIGNHGGGPSHEDVVQLRKLMAENPGRNICHGRPEDYVECLYRQKKRLPQHKGDLNPWAVGCYTSLIRVKQKHRLLESVFYSTEKLVTHAAMQGLMDYPGSALQEALDDLLFCEFHDILPGTSIPEVVAQVHRKMDHGLELLSRQRARAFFSLLSGQEPAEPDTYPLFIYNPHPFPVQETVVFEFQPPEPSTHPEIFWLPELRGGDGTLLPSQLEKESSNIANDHRKRVAFWASLLPGQMSRYICRIKEVSQKPCVANPHEKPWTFRYESCEVVIHPETGLVDRYRIDSVDYLRKNALRLIVMEDDPDPWGMRVRAFRKIAGCLTLMTREESARFAGVSASVLEPVRVIEDGPIRTIVEALFRYGDSSACVRIKIPKRGSEIEVEICVYWNEKDRMLKLSVPTVFKEGSCRGQVVYGVEMFKRTEDELVAQKWVGVESKDGAHGLTAINDGTYGFDFADGELRLSLVRSAAYSGHPVEGEPNIVPQDRFEPRIDQGEHVFRFWINGGLSSERFRRIDREATVKNERPMALVCFPSGRGNKPLPSVVLSDDVIQMTTLKMAEDRGGFIIRLYNPTGEERRTHVDVPFLNVAFPAVFKAYEIKTFSVSPKTQDVLEVDLMERNLR